MQNRFTYPTRIVLSVAIEQAKQLNQPKVTPEHVLMALLVGRTVASIVLERMNINLEQVKSEILSSRVKDEVSITNKPAFQSSIGEPQLSSSSEKILTLACEEAEQLDCYYVGTEHLLLGLMREKSTRAYQILSFLGADLDNARSIIKIIGESG